LSGLVLRQLVSTVEWWDSAGAEEALTSSVVVAKNALKRLETGLHLGATLLFDLSKSRTLQLAPGERDRQFVERYLENTGLDLYQLYQRAPADSNWRLVADVTPSGTPRAAPLDLSPELDAGRFDPARPVQSATGVFGLMAALPPDSTSGDARFAVVGYALPRDFFLRLSELQLGIGTFRALAGYAEVFKWYFRLAVLAILIGVSIVAVFAARALARHLSRPIADLATTFARVDGGSEIRVTPGGAPEVRQLGEAFNAMTARLTAARADLARAERAAAWEGVARQVAHEIKNPLTTISLALDNMEREFEALPADARTRVDKRVRSLEHELASLADLADSFSTLGALPIMRPTAVDVNALVESLVAISPWRHVEITTELAPVRPEVWADERQLRRVLRNLMKNACEAQPTGGRVRITTRRADEGLVAIAVADEGPGIPEAIQAHIFDTGFTTKVSGSGVGLSVSRRVIEQHGGTIEVDGAPGRGARFTVLLPERTP
ncbi:MAG: HAMP domain-containing sensor histidine kinase, partial [Candidatus Eisenbacteria bacterium]